MNETKPMPERCQVCEINVAPELMHLQTDTLVSHGTVWGGIAWCARCGTAYQREGEGVTTYKSAIFQRYGNDRTPLARGELFDLVVLSCLLAGSLIAISAASWSLYWLCCAAFR